MPFPFDLSQVFWGLMNKTMWDCRLGNINGFNGFNGAFMNSCWGSGFPTMGDVWNFSSSKSSTEKGGSAASVEDLVEQRKLERKQKALSKLLEDYAKTLPEGEERDTIEISLRRYKDSSKDNYSKLKSLYGKYETKIQAKFKNETKIEVSSDSKAAAEDFVKPNSDFKAILALNTNGKTTAKLKDGVDAIEFLHSLQSTNKKSFNILYQDALKGANTSKKAELKNVLQAVYKGLAESAKQLKDNDAVSEETKASIDKLLETAVSNATAEDVDQLYCHIRMAKAEIADSKYANLNEDFPNDPLLGKVNGVVSTTAELKTEGVEVETIKKQTVVEDESDLPGEKSMKELAKDNYVTELKADQLNELNAIDGVKKLFPDGIEKAWVDNDSRLNYAVIRYVDDDGNIKYIKGVGLKDGKIKAIGGEIKTGESYTPEKIKQRSATLASIKDAKDVLEEVKSKSNGTRVFQEKNITGNRNYKRLFIVDADGNLKEWKNTWYDKVNGFGCKKGVKTPYVDADLKNIKKDAEAVSKVTESRATIDTEAGKSLGKECEKLYSTWGFGNISTTLRTEINKDMVIGFLMEFRKNSIDRAKQRGDSEAQSVGFMELMSSKGSGAPGKAPSQALCNRVPKALLRKAHELGLANTDEYKALADYFGVKGTPKYDEKGNIAEGDTFNLTKNDDQNRYANVVQAGTAKKIDNMMYALLDKILELVLIHNFFKFGDSVFNAVVDYLVVKMFGVFHLRFYSLKSFLDCFFCFGMAPAKACF